MSPFVEVAFSKINGSIETQDYRGEGLVFAAARLHFHSAMIPASITGLEEDEPADRAPPGG